MIYITFYIKYDSIHRYKIYYIRFNFFVFLFVSFLFFKFSRFFLRSCLHGYTRYNIHACAAHPPSSSSSSSFLPSFLYMRNRSSMRLFFEMLASPKLARTKSTAAPMSHVRNAATAKELSRASSAVNTRVSKMSSWCSMP